MKKFLFKLAIFITPIILIAYVSQAFIDKSLKRTNYSSNYNEWNDIFESKINADLIIQGSSRAINHISPKHLDSIFKMNSYNLGMNGYEFQMQYYRFLIYMKYNKKPKYIIQTTDYRTLNKRTDLYMHEQFIPYLNNELIREAVIGYEGLDYRDIYIPLYKYIHNKSLFLGSINSLKGDVTSNGKYKGFQSINRNWDTTFLNFQKKNPNGYKSEIDSVTLRLFDSFVKYCSKNGIKLIFLNSPVYFEAKNLLKNSKTIDSLYLSYSQRYNIPYLNYSNDSICLDTANFCNSQHLNSRGVIKFNSILSHDLKTIIK